MKIRSTFLCVLAVFLALPLIASAQNASAPIVRQIEIQYAGSSTLSKERILANMRTAVGRPYSERAVEEDVRNLYATGNITNVRIFGEPLKDGVKVVVVVQTKATVGEVVIDGVSKFKPSRLRKKLSVKTGQTINEASLEQDRQKILEQYQEAGYTEAKVQFRVDTDNATGRVRVTFEVDEGGRTLIRLVRFEGNEAFRTKQLRKVVKTRPHNFLSFLTKNGRLQSEKTDEDVTSLREFYQDHGYADVQVSEPIVDRVEGGKVDLTYRIGEGPKYHVGSVAIEGAQVFTTDQIRSGLKTKEGNIFTPKVMRADAKAIQELYGSRGYIDAEIAADTTSGGSGLINITFRMQEGTQAYVERVNISGNTRTKDKVIRRELAVAPGDIYNSVRVAKSKERLQNLNYFEKIETYPGDTIVPGRKDLNVLVEEKRTGSFNFGGGFSSIDNLIAFAEIQQSNFDALHWPDFTGGGQRFRMRIQYGTRRKDFIIGLTEPWFLDYQVSVGGELFYREASFVSNVYAQRNYGFDINARKPISAFTSVRLEYRLERISLFDVSSDVSQAILDEIGDRTKSSLTAGITNDTRDSVFLTRKGHRIDLSGFVAGGPLGGNTDIYGFDLEASQYFKLPWDTIFLINGEVSTVTTWAGGDRVPIFDRLYLGGANNLRGFKFRDVSPKDENGEPIGGKSLARMTFEYTFPIVEKVRGALFYDVGFVNSNSYDFSPSNISSDFGFGVRLNLPIGPIRIDYGIPLQSDSFNKSSGGKFNFTIGYQF
jgi:outer membrane protein insertion porin family